MGYGLWDFASCALAAVTCRRHVGLLRIQICAGTLPGNILILRGEYFTVDLAYLHVSCTQAVRQVLLGCFASEMLRSRHGQCPCLLNIV